MSSRGVKPGGDGRLTAALDPHDTGPQDACGVFGVWAPGEDVFVPVEMSDEEAVKAFSKGFKAVVPYLRLTPQPDMRDGTEEDEEDEVQLTRIATAASGVRPGTGK